MCSSPEPPKSPRPRHSTLGLALALAAFLAATPARCEPLRVASRTAAPIATGQDWSWLSRWWSGIERWAGAGVRGLLPPTPNLTPSSASCDADTAPASGSDGGGGSQSDSGRDPNG